MDGHGYGNPSTVNPNFVFHRYRLSVFFNEVSSQRFRVYPFGWEGD